VECVTRLQLAEFENPPIKYIREANCVESLSSHEQPVKKEQSFLEI
jgi:hypothetical protein